MVTPTPLPEPGGAGATPVPLRATVDPAHGGRWTSLRAGDREWLWHRPDPARLRVRPDGAFVDAGGVEECLPTVRGVPDHGSAWSRPWRCGPDDTAVVDGPDYRLARRLRHHAGAVLADYRLTAAPGWRFVWAAHALLDLSDAALVHAPAGTPTRVFAEAAALLDPAHPDLPAGGWPPGAAWLAGDWPRPLGLRLETCGPADGSAVGAILTDLPEVRVSDAPRPGPGGAGGVRDELRFRLDCPGQPVSVALWRNLGGFPAEGGYRSIGVEPMLGRVFDLADASADADAATVPAGGMLDWRLTLTAGTEPAAPGESR